MIPRFWLILYSSVLSVAVLLLVVIPLISVFLKCNIEVAREISENTVLREDLLSSLICTFTAATVACAILLVISIPVGYVLSRCAFPGKTVLESLIDLPLLLPHPVVGIALLAAYGRAGTLGSVLNVDVQDTFWGIVLVMCVVSLPLMVDTVRVGFDRVDISLELVARSLGASFMQTFIKVVLPLCLRHILTGLVLSYARAVSEVGALLVLAYYPKTVNVLVIEWLYTLGLDYAIIASAILVVVSLGLFILLKSLYAKVR